MTPGSVLLLLLIFTMPLGIVVYWIVVGVRSFKRRKEMRQRKTMLRRALRK